MLCITNICHICHILYFSLEHPAEILFAYYLGDSPAHDVWAQTRGSNYEHNKAVIELFKQYFPGVHLFYTFGNHEG